MTRIKPVKHEFKATKCFKTTTHYTVKSEQPTTPLLTEKLNIAKSRGFAKSEPLYWCQERKNSKWVTPRLTGLFKTNKANVLWGCRGHYKDLILFVFKDNSETLTVYYFENYFTRNLDSIIDNLL